MMIFLDNVVGLGVCGIYWGYLSAQVGKSSGRTTAMSFPPHKFVNVRAQH